MRAAEQMMLYVDGGCTGNAHRDLSKRRMVSVVTDAEGTVVRESARSGGSSNIAELEAVALALLVAEAAGATAVTICTDSRNNLSWVNGRKVGKKLNDRDAVLRLREEIARLRRGMALTLLWVPREENLAGHVLEERERGDGKAA
jgi:ribonuclease HI